MADKLGKFVSTRTALFCCDIQEKFRPFIDNSPKFVDNSKKLIQLHQILKMPLIVTEQNPSRLGATLAELDINKGKKFSKTLFSMWTPEVMDYMLTNLPHIESIILFGLETHICVQQTALDLLENNYKVHIIKDAVISRYHDDTLVAIERMRNSGAFITTLESAIFMILGDYKHPKFKEIQNLINIV